MTTGLPRSGIVCYLAEKGSSCYWTAIERRTNGTVKRWDFDGRSPTHRKAACIGLLLAKARSLLNSNNSTWYELCRNAPRETWAQSLTELFQKPAKWWTEMPDSDKLSGFRHTKLNFPVKGTAKRLNKETYAFDVDYRVDIESWSISSLFFVRGEVVNSPSALMEIAAEILSNEQEWAKNEPAGMLRDALDEYMAKSRKRKENELPPIAEKISLQDQSDYSQIPTQFRAVVADKTKNFIGRKHVFNAIDAFIEKENCGYFLIQGDPGEGKSSLLAEFVRRNNCIVHFNIRSAGIITARQFIDGIQEQLTKKYCLDNLNNTDYSEGRRLINLLAMVKEKSGADKVVIAVDALDEVEQSQTLGANILYLPASLPENVYFILTRRRVQAADMPLMVYSPKSVFDLMDYINESKHDIKEYLQSILHGKLWDDVINKSGFSKDDYLNSLLNKSQCNFMYLYYVIPELLHGSYRQINFDKLPLGLQGFYEDHWMRMGMSHVPAPRAKINIVYILSEVQEPVSRKFIWMLVRRDFAQSDEAMVQETLDEWRQFLHVKEGFAENLYSVYHASFRDFLNKQKILTAAGVSKQQIHALIASAVLHELDDIL